jgi:hypothetical protein
VRRTIAAAAVTLAAACAHHPVEAEPVTSNDLVEQLQREALAGATRADSRALPRAIQAGRPLLPALVRGAATPDRRSYLVAEAIRAIDPASFDALDPSVQLRVYVDALAHAGAFNDWGFPGGGGQARGDWLERQGAAAVPLLAPLLDDQREAPTFGSQEATLARAWRNRVCDYALYFVLALRGQRPAWPRDPAARDAMIADLKRALAVDAAQRNGGQSPGP